MKSMTISEVMEEDHDKIEKLLNDFGKCIEFDKKTLKKAYEKFTWELEKHLFTEEKVIFTAYEPEDYLEGYKMIPRLMQEHDTIYKKLKGMNKLIKSNKQCNFQEFKDIFTKHKDFENEQVYPKFDQELDETTKEMIIKRMKEVKLTENGLKNLRFECSECGKKIGLINSYYNSKLSKRWIFCSRCYDKIEGK